MAPEVAEMKRWLHGLLSIPNGDKVVDLGCGAGDDLQTLAKANPRSKFVGADQSEEQIRIAKANNAFNNLEFVCTDLSQTLPFGDNEFDVLYSVNLLECLPNKDLFVSECARVLKPGGQILIAHFDWDTQTFDGEDRALVRRIVHAFNDWQQAWMQAVDPWAGRRLNRYFTKEGHFTGQLKVHTLTSTSFEPESYGRQQAESFGALVKRGMITRDEYESFIRFQHDLVATDAFLYTVALFAFVGTNQ